DIRVAVREVGFGGQAREGIERLLPFAEELVGDQAQIPVLTATAEQEETHRQAPHIDSVVSCESRIVVGPYARADRPAGQQPAGYFERSSAGSTEPLEPLYVHYVLLGRLARHLGDSGHIAKTSGT